EALGECTAPVDRNLERNKKWLEGWVQGPPAALFFGTNHHGGTGVLVGVKGLRCMFEVLVADEQVQLKWRSAYRVPSDDRDHPSLAHGRPQLFQTAIGKVRGNITVPGKGVLDTLV